MIKRVMTPLLKPGDIIVPAEKLTSVQRYTAPRRGARDWLIIAVYRKAMWEAMWKADNFYVVVYVVFGTTDVITTVGHEADRWSVFREDDLCQAQE